MKKIRTLHISKKSWIEWLKHVTADHQLIAPVKTEVAGDNEKVVYGHIPTEAIDKMFIPNIRLDDPFKPFLYPVQEKVAEYFSAKEYFDESATRIVLGLRGCDIAAIKNLDKIFVEGEFSLPEYKDKRIKTILVSIDCRNPQEETCFCTRVEGKPYPEEGYDLNLVPIEDSYLVEVGSDIGNSLVEEKRGLFQEPDISYLQLRDNQRKKAVDMLNKFAEQYPWKNEPVKLVVTNPNSAVWKDDIAKNCVECNACRYVCPSCYCFLLYDQQGPEKNMYSRIKAWDSCQYTGYGRVAGGANPRPHKHERLQNFYFCKYNYRKENFNLYGCVGCGRCISACPAKIDVRKSLQKLG